MLQISLLYVKTTFKAETKKLNDVAKIMTTILYMIKFPVERNIYELENNMLSVSDDLTDLRTDGIVNCRNSFAVRK